MSTTGPTTGDPFLLVLTADPKEVMGSLHGRAEHGHAAKAHLKAAVPAAEPTSKKKLAEWAASLTPDQRKKVVDAVLGVDFSSKVAERMSDEDYEDAGYEGDDEW